MKLLRFLFDKLFSKKAQVPEQESDLSERSSSERIGDEFERYVVSLFVRSNNRCKRAYFSIEYWTQDINRKRGEIGNIEIISDLYPDLILCYNGKEYFAVECKYRNQFFFSKESHGKVIKWSYPAQMDRYQQFQKMKNIPVFIVIGVGGTPSCPMKMYCLPLNDAKYPELYEFFLEKYERGKKPFYWRNGKLH